MNEHLTDVLVIGAGPAGLALANNLLRQDASVRVMDQAPGPPQLESSFLLHCRGAEVLLVTLRFRATPGPENPFLPMVISQAKIGQALRDRSAAMGGIVEWSSELVDIDQDATGITAMLGDGKQAPTRWLVDCDRADSIVRKLAGIEFPGRDGRYSLIAAAVDWDLDRQVLTGAASRWASRGDADD